MIDIDKGKETIDKADGFFTRLNQFIRKHPVWFVVVLIGVFFWWASTLPEVEEEVAEPVVTEQPKTTEPTYTITKKTYIVDKEGYRKGDTIYIDYYSDGVIEKYYTDGEVYKGN